MSQSEKLEVKKKDSEAAAMWAFGLILSGLAALCGRLCEWLFGPSEPSAWWTALKWTYYGVVGLIAVSQMVWGAYQIYRIERDYSRETKAAKLAGQTASGDGPTQIQQPPKGVLGWCLHVLAAAGCFAVIGGLMAAAWAFLQVIASVKEWFWSLLP